MDLTITVVADTASNEQMWAKRLREVAGHLLKVKITVSADSPNPATWGDVTFIDAEHSQLEEVLKKIDRSRRAVFLMAPNADVTPEAFMRGEVDDVLVYPFRTAEFVSKIQRYQHVIMWAEISKMNASFTEVLDHLKEDLQLASRLQKNRLPLKFPNIRGFKIETRYLAGMKSGGDHMDLAEGADGSLLSMILSDSSSYGLCSAVLSAIMRVALRLNSDEARSCIETVAQIQKEITAILSPKDTLSMFYGVLSRKDYKLRYLNLGSSRAFYAKKDEKFAPLNVTGAAINRSAALVSGMPMELALEPESKLILLSDGFVDACGGEEATVGLLDQLFGAGKDAKDVLNELVFKVKSKFTEPDDMPEQDCTAMILEVDSKILRLA